MPENVENRAEFRGREFFDEVRDAKLFSELDQCARVADKRERGSLCGLGRGKEHTCFAFSHCFLSCFAPHFKKQCERNERFSLHLKEEGTSELNEKMQNLLISVGQMCACLRSEIQSRRSIAGAVNERATISTQTVVSQCDDVAILADILKLPQIFEISRSLKSLTSDFKHATIDEAAQTTRHHLSDEASNLRDAFVSATAIMAKA